MAGDELTEEDERREAEGDDAMAWSERAVRQHWLWHRLRLLDLCSGELSVGAGLAGRHVAGMTQRPGHGQAFAAMVVGAVGQDERIDTLTGIDDLVADGVADPSRLGIAGWSHGGFLAAWAVTQTDRFRAATIGLA